MMWHRPPGLCTRAAPAFAQEDMPTGGRGGRGNSRGASGPSLVRSTVVLRDEKGETMWHFQVGTMVSNAPSTYMLDGK